MVTLTIIPTNLGVTTIFTQTNTKHPLLNQLLFIHHLVYGCEQIITASAPGHAQDPISSLRIEIIGLLFNTSKSVHKAVVTFMEILTKVNLVSRNIPIVVTALSIPLIKFTLVIGSTLA